MEAYEEDLAYVHDVGFGAFARAAAPGLVEMLRRAGIDGGLVVDLGCGSGQWAEAAVDAGFEVFGIDLSAAMVERARQRVPQGEFQAGSFFDARLPRCVAVTSLGECFNYLFDRDRFDRGARRQALGRLFRRVYAALRPGGLFLFDVATPGRAAASGPARRHAQGDGWAVLVEVAEDAERRVLTRRITTFRQVGDRYRRREETHRLALYPASELTAELLAAGFTVRTLSGYGAARLGDGLVGFRAHRP